MSKNQRNPLKRIAMLSICALGMILGSACAPAQTPIEKTTEGTAETQLFFLGRASVRILLPSGKTLYIDPAEGEKSAYSVPADYVLVTHQHSDHNQVNLLTLNEGAQVLQCPQDIKSGETASLGEMEVRAVSAHNGNHSQKSGCGYVITLDDLVIYHSGDTSKTDDMGDLSAYNIDYALLCMDGFYNMGPAEAQEVADLIKPRVVIPIHTSKNGLFDQANVDSFTFDQKLVLKPGESATLTSKAK